MTPMGKVKVNTIISNELINTSSFFSYKPEADLYEHNLEVQLPFLQEILGSDIRIVPILVGSENRIVQKEIARKLQQWFNSDNLFIISTDFSHYPGYYDAKRADSITAEAIVQNNPDILYEALLKNKEENIKGLSTSLCGANAISILLNITHEQSHYKYIPLHYRNSGDSPFGEKERVVGYYSMKIVRDIDSKECILTTHQKKQLLHLARKTLEYYLKTNIRPKYSDFVDNEIRNERCGVFVTLYKHDELRGCIGRFNPDMPLPELIMEMAISSALYDRRFTPVEIEELDDIRIEISVLTPMKKINSEDEIILGKHGIYISKGHYNGTFLPKVAVQTGWSLTDFLGHCSRDKAGLGWTGWKDADIYTFESIDFIE
jgi:AmmeMemoRadiSam system protein A